MLTLMLMLMLVMVMVDARSEGIGVYVLCGSSVFLGLYWHIYGANVLTKGDRCGEVGS